VSGPFPQGLLASYRELGRLNPPDEVSADGLNWFPLDDVPALAILPIDDTANAVRVAVEGEVDWARERGRARRRWLEERGNSDRRSGEDGDDGGGQPRGPDRRSDPNARESVHFAPDAAAGNGRRAALAVALGVVVAVGLAALVIWKFVPVNEFNVVLLRPAAPDCAASPAPGVRWSGCDKRDAMLAAASLSGADLRNAILAGADLSRSRLDGANLSNVDLRGANLEGADMANTELTGARLDEATWIDGRRCERGSVGRCVLAPQ
jgi:hypothetical protein